MQIQYVLAGLGLLRAAIATPLYLQRGYYDISDDSECDDTPRRPQPYDPVNWNDPSSEWPWDSECVCIPDENSCRDTAQLTDLACSKSALSHAHERNQDSRTLSLVRQN